MFGLPASDLASVEAYPLSLEQRDHLKTYIPRTFLKLDSQRPVHIVALGDSVTWMYTRDDNNGNWLLSYLGTFSNQLAREFFYPGGVRALNPEKGFPEKLKDHIGKEIFIENLAIPGRCALDGLQRITTDAFVNQPDLVLVDFGINDAVRGHSLDSYRKALQQIVDAGKANGADVILLAPSIIRASNGPTGWGMTRPYATVVKEVAAKNQVLFVDLGAALAPLGGGIPAGVQPEAAVLTMTDRLGRIFEFDPMPVGAESLHPNEEAHKVMGRKLFSTLMTPTPEVPPYRLEGKGGFEGNDSVKVDITIRNQSETPREGYVGALSMGRTLTPKDPYQAFSLKPRETKSFEFIYERAEDANAAGGRAALDVGDPNLRLSYFIVDEQGSRIEDLVTRLAPVSIDWTQQVFQDLSDGVRFEWQFVNGISDTLNAKYRIGMGEAVSGWVPFNLDGLGAKKFQATFPFTAPKDAVRMKTQVFVEVEVDGKKFTFPRELEATQDVGLGQRIALSKFSDYGTPSKLPVKGSGALGKGDDGVVVRMDADPNFLYCTFDFENVTFSQIPNGGSSMTTDIALDARPIAEVGGFGFVDKIRVTTGTTDGPASIGRLQLAAFGNGYNMAFPDGGVRAELTTNSPGVRRLEVKIPKSYLFLYDGQIGDSGAIMGLNFNVTMAELDDSGQVIYPAERRYVLNAPFSSLSQSLYYRDPRGFSILRLVNAPAKTWSAHLY